MNLAVHTPLPDRLPPQSLDAEQAVLGCALISRTAVEKISELLRRDDFSLRSHQLVFDVVTYLADRDTPSDVLTVPEELKRREQFEAVGGQAYINTLTESVPTAAHVEYYAATVREKAKLRKLIDAGGELIAAAHEQEETADDIGARAIAQVENALDGKARARLEWTSPVDFARSALDRYWGGGETLAVTTGFPSLDRPTGGLRSGDLVFIGGRPGMGKSVLCCSDIPLHLAAQEVPVDIYSLEMSAAQLYDRLLAILSDTPLVQLVSRQVPEERARPITDALERLREMPLAVLDRRSIGLNELIREARRRKRKFGTRLIVIDYLQRINPPRAAGDNRSQVLGYLARELKTLAGECDCPVLVPSSLSRELEKRDNKRPVMSDLRDSGELEHEADMIGMLYRPDYYRKPEDRPKWHPTELNWVKWRQGPEGTRTDLVFVPPLAHFMPGAAGAARLEPPEADWGWNDQRRDLQ